jgi:hypothetical protein
VTRLLAHGVVVCLLVIGLLIQAGCKKEEETMEETTPATTSAPTSVEAMGTEMGTGGSDTALTETGGGGCPPGSCGTPPQCRPCV